MNNSRNIGIEHPPSEQSISNMTIAKRFIAYLSGDGLSYLLGFAIYGFLLRVLSDQRYGAVSIGINLYQVFVMFVALGVDLFGPRIIISRRADAAGIVRRVQNVRMGVALLVCAPLMAGAAVRYCLSGQKAVAGVILAGFTMVLARTVDVNYVAVAFSAPMTLAHTRVLGLVIFFGSLLLFRPLVVEHLWIIPVLNAAGVTIGRVRLMHLLRSKYPSTSSSSHAGLPSVRFLLQVGLKSSAGQLILVAMWTLDVVLLAHYVPIGDVGQYAMVSRLYLFGTGVLTALLNTFLPELMRAADNHDQFVPAFRRFWAISASVGFVGLTAFWAFAPFVCELLAHRPLIIAGHLASLYGLVFVLMAMCNPFLSLLPGLKRESRYLSSIVTAAVVVLICDIVLVPKIGVVGAAYGQICGALTLLILCAASMRPLLRSFSHQQEFKGKQIITSKEVY